MLNNYRTILSYNEEKRSFTTEYTKHTEKRFSG